MRAFESRGVDCRWTAPDLRLRDAHASADVMRLLQEGLTNVLRHSDATQVEVAFEADAAQLRMSVIDNGHGFDPQTTPAGVGLHSMRTRTTRLGGSFELESSPAGTRLCIVLPGVVQEEAGATFKAPA
jgi:signal transduction histidine kinase